jgi:hypothetical protein
MSCQTHPAPPSGPTSGTAGPDTASGGRKAGARRTKKRSRRGDRQVVQPGNDGVQRLIDNNGYPGTITSCKTRGQHWTCRAHYTRAEQRKFKLPRRETLEVAHIGNRIDGVV